jgi:hypothetical protein
MRAIWVDEGNDANFAKLRQYGITSPYYAIRDPRVTKSYLQAVRAQGFPPGVYVAPNWYPDMPGPAFAEFVDGLMTERYPSTGATFPKVCVDIETHNVPYITGFLKRWRELRPTRVTDWTLEPFQGGLFDPLAVAIIIESGVGIVPQNYFGDMSAAAADRVAIDLIVRGFPPTSMLGFYDAAALPGRWQGYAFTQGRLP